MAELTLREAARQVGVSRQSVYRMVKDGRLTATVRHDGQKVVDTAELLRVFGSLSPRQSPGQPETVAQGDSPRQPATVTATPPAPQAMTADERRREVEIADREALRAELQAARERIRDVEGQLQEAREREAKLMELAQSATRLLEHREAAAAPPPRGFWRRLFGG